MTKINKPPIFNDISELVEIFFDDDGKCYVSNSIPYIVILFLSFIAPEGYKIFIVNSKQFLDDKKRIDEKWFYSRTN